jgi:hypothetical protein
MVHGYDVTHLIVAVIVHGFEEKVLEKNVCWCKRQGNLVWALMPCPQEPKTDQTSDVRRLKLQHQTDVSWILSTGTRQPGFEKSSDIRGGRGPYPF